MPFAEVDYVAVLVAAALSFGFGAVYYSTLATHWLAAIGKTKADMEANRSPVPFVTAAIALLVMSWMLAGLMAHIGTGQTTATGGILTGFFVWLGFVLTTQAVNHGFQGARRSQTLIDAGHWLGVLLVQGLVIGLFGA